MADEGVSKVRPRPHHIGNAILRRSIFQVAASVGSFECRLMGWSGRAPCQREKLAMGSKRGARHVSQAQFWNRRGRYRYRQELVSRGGSRSAWRDCPTPEVVLNPARLSCINLQRGLLLPGFRRVGRWPSCGVAEKARIGRDLFRSEDDPPAAKPATPLSEASCHSSG
jgi:hypothetical protein